MSLIAYDSQSLMVDGRRLWLVAASFDYTRIPRLSWRTQLQRARAQGFNCISISIPWCLHEPAQGRFDFTGERDLRHLLQLLRDLGLYCILKPGPYLGTAFEGGGLPAWLRALPDVKLREGNGPFLDACARWFAALMQQMGDLQVSNDRSPANPQPGPVLLVQVEHDWRCQNEEQATKYLRELTRYLRESGCALPFIEANNGWQPIESAFSIWRGSDDLAATMRQFRAVQQMPPMQQFPLLASGVQVRANGRKSDDDLVNIAQALAVGAQVELEMHPPAGRLVPSLDLPGPVRPLAMFAQQFSQLFANLHADRPHAAIAPLGSDHEMTLLHQHGTQGDVVFLFKSERDKSDHANLLLPDGQTMRVELGDERVAWIVFNVNLSGVAKLDHTNLRPLAFVDQRLLVLVGPAGSAGTLCIDGSPIDVNVPVGKMPAIVRTDAVTLAILSTEQAQACAITVQGLYVGVNGVDQEDAPLPHRAFKQIVLVRSDGTTSKISAKAAEKSTAPPRLGPWSAAPATALVDGTSAAYEEVAPGSSLSQLAPEDRMGFYRIDLPTSRLGANLLAPHWTDRALLFHRGKPASELPANSNGTMSAPFTLKPASQITLLAAQDGHGRDGWRLEECKGLHGHLYQAKPIKLPKPRQIEMRLPDTSRWRGFLCDVSYHVRPVVGAWSWNIKPTGKHGLIVTIDDLPCRVLVLVNDVPVGGYDPIESSGRVTITVQPGAPLTGGRNRIDLVAMENDDRHQRLDPRRFVRIYDALANVTAKAQWHFAPLREPADDAFAPIKRGLPRQQPAWFRTTFNSPRTAQPLYLEITGSGSGQAWLNGRSLGTFQAGTPLHLPHDLLSAEPKQPNFLTIFDERGRQPRSCRLRFGV